MKSLKLSILVILTVVFYLKGNSQIMPIPKEFKNRIRIGIYFSPEINLHTKVVTGIVEFYTNEEKRRYENYKNDTNGLARQQKQQYDSTDVFKKLFSISTTFLSLALNGSKPLNQKPFTDTLFLPTFKIEEVEESKIDKLIMQDSLDYCITIKNFKSIKAPPYFNIGFDLSIYPKSKEKGIFTDKAIILFSSNSSDKGNSLFTCNQPFDCLISNISTYTIKAIIKKLFKDGYCKEQEEEFRKANIIQ